MGWKQWTGVALLIGGGILLQIPGHDRAPMDHATMGHGDPPVGMAQAQGPYTTVALDVTGMT